METCNNDYPNRLFAKQKCFAMLRCSFPSELLEWFGLEKIGNIEIGCLLRNQRCVEIRDAHTKQVQVRSHLFALIDQWRIYHFRRYRFQSRWMRAALGVQILLFFRTGKGFKLWKWCHLVPSGVGKIADSHSVSCRMRLSKLRFILIVRRAYRLSWTESVPKI